MRINSYLNRPSVSFLALLLGIGSSITFAGPFSQYEGTWTRAPADPDKPHLGLFEGDGTLTGSTVTHYTDEGGRPTGESVEYFFEFNSISNDGSASGKLQSFDSRYSCFFDNGPAKIEKVSANQAKLIFDRVFFQVRSYRYQTGVRRVPRYCTHPGWRRSYYCGVDIEPVYGPRQGHECILTQRVKTVIPIVRD